jgi:acyl-CoA thioesterase-1
LLLAGLAAVACSSGTSPRGSDAGSASRPSASTPKPAPRARIVALGDSLTAGYGLPKEQAYPALLQRRLDAEGYRYEVVNAGVSGDTTAGGVNRLEWSLDGDVRILIVALGANDGLRGLPVVEMKRNLSTIIERAKDRHITVLLAGMEALTNLGPQYRRAFHDVFPSLAREHDVAFLPFLLDGIAGRPEYNQPDGVHPSADGARRIADQLWPALEPLLEAR